MVRGCETEKGEEEISHIVNIQQQQQKHHTLNNWCLRVYVGKGGKI